MENYRRKAGEIENLHSQIKVFIRYIIFIKYLIY